MGCNQCKTACKTAYLKMVNYFKKLDVKKTDESIVDIDKINDLFEPRLKDSPIPVPIPVLTDNEFDYEMVN
jgi:hypothetical protein